MLLYHQDQHLVSISPCCVWTVLFVCLMARGAVCPARESGPSLAPPPPLPACQEAGSMWPSDTGSHLTRKSQVDIPERKLRAIDYTAFRVRKEAIA